jgi:hypothetical protein
MSATTTSTKRDWHHDKNNYDGGGDDRSRRIFWDDNNDNRSTVGVKQYSRRNAPPNTCKQSSSSSAEALQKWENESIMRVSGGDRLQDDVFEIGNPSSNNYNDYYLSQVQDDLEELEVEDEDVTAGNNNNDNDTTAGSTTKDEVVNAYRDYLRSIRDGGFESYLDEDVGDVAENIDVLVDRDHHHRLDVDEEDRRVNGLFYGVHDVRRTSSSSSQYSAWRARARQLREEEEEKNRRGQKNVGDERWGSDNDGPRSYRIAMLHRSAWFRPTMAVSCLQMALTTGIHNYKHENSSSNATLTGGLMATLSEVGGDSIQHKQLKGGGAMDAILNALKIFDPVWFDRHMGWEGIGGRDTSIGQQGECYDD